MHPDLSPHLHTPECNALIEALKNCHKEHSIRMYMGYCNKIEHAMTKCMKKERIERRRLNGIKAQEMRKKIIEAEKICTFVPPKE